jgi:NADPH-dependent 2,4-dienoyl-CoA reductase/sulfur reductase-like enzyme
VIAVVGAGPAGLAAAWRAAAAGHEVVVLERGPQVGGMAGSFEVAGLRVDHGSHRLHPATPAPVLAALRGLLGDELQTRPRHGRIRLLDRWATATWVALTMHGWWWPGRQVVVVVPCVVLAVAWWAGRVRTARPWVAAAGSSERSPGRGSWSRCSTAGGR